MSDSSAACLLDASAILALLHREPGADAVAAILVGSAVSAVNWSEVLQKATARGIDASALDDDFAALGVEVLEFGRDEARAAARIWLDGGQRLSLADRACLATATTHRLMVATADRTWANLNLAVAVSVIR